MFVSETDYQNGLQSELIRYFGLSNKVPIHVKVAEKKGIYEDLDAELCLVREDDSDPRYWLLTRDRKDERTGILGVIGFTGMLESITRIKQGRLSPLVARANAYGFFECSGQDAPKTQEEIKGTIDKLYNIIHSLQFRLPTEEELFREWDAQRLLARFGDYAMLHGPQEIIPEYQDTTVIVKVSEGCPRKCIYCPEPGGVTLYSLDQIIRNMHLARALQEKYHSNSKGRMNEGFLNNPDILYLHLARKLAGKKPQDYTALDRLLLRKLKNSDTTRIADPIEIAYVFSMIFPELQKKGAFFGVPTINQTEKEYLVELREQRIGRITWLGGINRAYIGQESFDNLTSRFLGKNETQEEKEEATAKMLETGYKVKVIVQVGAVGEGFFYGNNQFRTSREGLAVTADSLARIWREASEDDRRLRIIISRYVPIEGTPLKKMHEEGKVIKPYPTPEGLEGDVRFLVSELKSRRVPSWIIEDHYESALQGKTRS